MPGAFPQGFIETVRNAGDIVRLVSDYVPLKQAGIRHKGLCPFHQEKTPSFSVDPNRQLFYCFGCQTGGDIFKFVQLYEKVPFPEAVEIVAKRSGVPMPKQERKGPAGPLERLQMLCDSASQFFRGALEHPKNGAAARAYIEKRGLDEATSKRLALGFAPESWEALRGHLLQKRFRAEEGRTAGLLLQRKSGSGEYDRFRNRLIFPIRDVQGRTRAFGGRALGDDEPKYINSPETPAYKKGEHLYGLDLAKESIRREGFAIVVEGYLDLAAVMQAGFVNVVASLGTAFTEAQARLLARYCERVVFSYDGDTAGAAATVRSLDMLLSKGFDVRVVPLPAGTDPDDYIRDHGAQAYGDLLKEAPVYLEFLIRREARDRDLSRLDDKVAAVQAVLPHLARLSSVVERSSWTARLADALHIDEEWVLQELRGAVRTAKHSIRQRPPQSRPVPEAEMRLVTCLLRAAEQNQLPEDVDLTDLAGSRVEPIVRLIVERAFEGKTVDYPTILDALEDEADRTLLTGIAFREEPDDGPGVDDCLAALRRRRLAREEKQLAREIGDLQKGAVSTAEIDKQLLRLQELARQRDSLS